MKKQFFSMLTVCCLTSFIAQAQTITSFKFSAESIGWEEDFEGVIDDENHTITFTTQQWIENIEQLPAIYEIECEECEVKIGDEVQERGVTMNDFRKAVVYSIGDIQYTVRFVSPQATGIPVIKIETQGGVEVTSKEDWTNMTSFALIDPNDESNNISKGAYNSTQYHRIRGRGNSTWGYPKKPYRIRFREDVSLFGKSDRENWALLAEYLDPTFYVRLKKGLPEGTYNDELLLRFRNRGFVQTIIIPLHFAVNEKVPTGIPPFQQPEQTLRAWTGNGMLHVTGIKSGDTIRVFDTSGTLVYQRITSSEQMEIPLREPGMYLVRVGESMVRAVNYE